MHASGHALLAAAGGGLARALAGDAGGGPTFLAVALARIGRGDPLLGLAILGTCAAVVKTAGAALAGHAEARVAGEVGAAVRREVLDRVLAGDGLRPPRHVDHARGGAGDLAALTTHVTEVERGVAQGVLGEARGLAQLVPLSLLLVVLAPRLAGSALVAMSAFGVVVLATRRALRRAHTRAAQDAERLLGAGDEAVRHADLWVTYGATGAIRRHLAAVSERIVDAQAWLRASGALVSGTSEVLGGLALVLVVALASGGMLGGVDRATLVPFAVAFFMAYKPLREVVDARLARARGEAALAAAVGRRGAEPAPSAPPRAETAPARDAPWPTADLVLEGVVGAHGRHVPLTVRVRAGEILAVVGPTGVGKSSLVRALLGLEAPRAGAVSYAGVSLDDQGAGPRARPFAWVPQDAPVLAATLAENVALAGGGDATLLAERCLEELGAKDLARDARVELASGRRLSGGERQLVALARALATELPVLLCDEPTSALDPEAQREVLAALARLRGRRTIVLVTHRSEPLAIADRVVRLGPALEVDDAQRGARLDDERVAAHEVAVDDPRALAGREPQRSA